MVGRARSSRTVRAGGPGERDVASGDVVDGDEAQRSSTIDAGDEAQRSSTTVGTGSWRDLLSAGRRGTVAVLCGGVLLFAVDTYVTASLLPSAVAEIEALARVQSRHGSALRISA